MAENTARDYERWADNNCNVAMRVAQATKGQDGGVYAQIAIAQALLALVQLAQEADDGLAVVFNEDLSWQTPEERRASRG